MRYYWLSLMWVVQCTKCSSLAYPHKPQSQGCIYCKLFFLPCDDDQFASIGNFLGTNAWHDMNNLSQEPNPKTIEATKKWIKAVGFTLRSGTMSRPPTSNTGRPFYACPSNKGWLLISVQKSNPKTYRHGIILK